MLLVLVRSGLSVMVAGAALPGSTVVHLDESGYRVALVRGAGVKEARWSDVEDAVTASPGASRAS